MKNSRNLTVVGILVNDRSERAPHLQEVITRHGSDVICRMGIPTTDKEVGLITLVMDGPEESARGLTEELKTLKDISVNTMTF